MIVGFDPKTAQVRCFGDDTSEGRQWCYEHRWRTLYEVDGRRSFKDRVLPNVLADGRLLTSGKNRPRRK